MSEAFYANGHTAPAVDCEFRLPVIRKNATAHSAFLTQCTSSGLLDTRRFACHLLSLTKCEVEHEFNSRYYIPTSLFPERESRSRNWPDLRETLRWALGNSITCVLPAHFTNICRVKQSAHWYSMCLFSKWVESEQHSIKFAMQLRYFSEKTSEAKMYNAGRYPGTLDALPRMEQPETDTWCELFLATMPTFSQEKPKTIKNTFQKIEPKLRTSRDVDS